MDSARDEAAAGFLDAWRLLGEVVDGASMRVEGPVAVGTTGLPVPTMNGVWATSPGVTPGRLSALLDEVEPVRPHCAQVPAGTSPELAGVLTDRGMMRIDDVPLMVLDSLASLAPTALAVRVLEPSEVVLHAEVAAAGFGAPEEVFRRLVTPRLAAAPQTTLVVGEVDGEPVTTGLSIAFGGRAGVFNIATPQPHRGNGYGAAVTAWLVHHALHAGSHLAWLQSSTSGFGVYQRLGFRVVDTWQCWITG